MQEEIDPHDIEPEDWLINWQFAKYSSPTILINVGKRYDEDNNLIGLDFKERAPSLRIHSLSLEAITDHDFFSHQKPTFNDEGEAVVRIDRRRTAQ